MATTIDPNSISWREPHQKALAERDQAKLLKHVYATEGALFLRWQELCHGDDHSEELQEMDLAAQDLLRIQTEELGWPPVRLHTFDDLWGATTGGPLKEVMKHDEATSDGDQARR